MPPPEDKKDVQQEAIDKFLGGVKDKKALTGESAFSKLTTKQKPMTTALMADNPSKPTVMNGRMKVFYDKPHFTKSKDHILVALQLSIPLEQEHDDLLPKIIIEAHKDVLKRGRKRILLNGLPAQHASIYLTHDDEEELVVLPACKLVSANVALVERKGEGSSRKVVRFSFRLQAEYSRSLAIFAESNLQNDFWLVMKESQESLWDEDEE